jgi:murein DD-endopeptidase MepM/ murein hydrolase activator NlpD
MKSESILMSIFVKVKPGLSLILFIFLTAQYSFSETTGKILSASGQDIQSLAKEEPLLWPLADGSGNITSRFGERPDPLNKGKTNFHTGLDIAGKLKTPILAVMDGTVTDCEIDGDYGLRIILKHSNGFTTLYSKLNEISGTITVGTQVHQGQTIGFLGKSGKATGYHLHYEIRKENKQEDPEVYLLKKGKIIYRKVDQK